MSERWVSLQGLVNDKGGQALMRVMNECLAERVDHVHLMISSGGGNVLWGASLFSQIRRMPLEVSTYNVSTVQSIAVTLFCAGGRRYCVPEATFMIHPVLIQPVQNQWYNAQQLREFSDTCTVQTRSLAQIIATVTGNETDRVVEDMNRTTWFNAEKAKAYGLVDEVITDLLPASTELTAIYEDGTIRICPPRLAPDLASLFPAIKSPAKPGSN